MKLRSHTKLLTLSSIGMLLTLSACRPAASNTDVVPVDQPTSSSSVASVAAVTSEPATSAASSTEPADTKLAANVSLDVPFAPQAPFANWDALHEETCEEMSLIMVKHFLDGTDLSLDQAETEVQALVEWMSENGYGYDVTANEIAKVAKDFYNLNATVDTNVTEESIKRHLANGNPVIIPAAGRMLGNPYFSGEGPWYHMLVITGYKDGLFGTTFITNDPGTKRGKGYEYKSATILNAIHDWTGVKEEIASGAKAMIIVTR